jgi:RimJ/RimL family protein N-acetyltransferase
LALLWDKGNNVFYLSGDPDPVGEATGELARFMHSQIRERALAEGLGRFKAHALSRALERSLVGLFQGCDLRETAELFYAFQQPQVNPVRPPALEGVRFAMIDADLLERDDLENLQHVRSEVEWMWPSRERFYERGFGYAALYGEAAICWCTAEYVSEERCGVGIETVPAFQNVGVGTGTAARFVEHCLERGITPHWECYVGNAASVRVAEKVGFARVCEPLFWSGGF